MEVERVPIRDIPVHSRAGDTVQLDYNGILFCLHEKTYRALYDIDFEIKTQTIDDIVNSQ